MIRPLLSTAVESLRRADRRLGQRGGHRRILVDARTPVNFTMIAPVFRSMAADPRVSFFFTASEEPERLRDIYREAPDVALLHPAAARRMRFDAYVASDFMWQSLPRGTRRIQVFHGVGGKYGFDAPTVSMRAWDRIFFVNERRLRNFVKAGAIDADSPAIRLVGLPKADALVNGTWTRRAVLDSLGLDPARPTVLYAPTWSPASSLNAMGTDLIRRLLAEDVNLIVKLHDRSRDVRPQYSGGVDWVAALSSAGFEYLLRDRPIVRVHRPELIREANIHPDYVELLASVSDSVEGVDDAVGAVRRGLAGPDGRSDARRAVAADLFYRPGGATDRAIGHLYEAIDLDPVPAAVAQEVPCRL